MDCWMIDWRVWDTAGVLGLSVPAGLQPRLGQKKTAQKTTWKNFHKYFLVKICKIKQFICFQKISFSQHCNWFVWIHYLVYEGLIECKMECLDDCTKWWMDECSVYTYIIYEYKDKFIAEYY